jgi:norsolorinic acid ketoreductase
MTSTTKILITGTRKGCGLGLLKGYAALDNHTIVAAINYAPDSEEAKTMLAALTLGTNTTVIPLAYDAASPTSAATLVNALPSTFSHIDILIANAAFNRANLAKDQGLDELEVLIKTNAFGPLALYQATRDLLEAAATPRYIYISSLAASMAESPQLPVPLTAVSMSKAAGNAFVVQANKEEKKIVLVTMNPGWVQSESGNMVANMLGMEKAPTEMGWFVEKVIRTIDGMTKEKSGGKFINAKGETVPW